MNYETELDFFSPDDYYSDSVSEETDNYSFITQSLDEGENENVLPDAIPVFSDEEDSSYIEYEEETIESNLSMDQVDSPTLASDQAEVWSDLQSVQTENQSDLQTNDSNNELNNDSVIPDAIQIVSDDEQTSENLNIDENMPSVSVDLADSSIQDPGRAEEWSVQDPEQTKNHSVPEKPKNETVNTNNETLSSIYKLLDERIPEHKIGESESESESDSESESEVSLEDLKIILENIESYESEQLSGIYTVNDNIINSVNNDYHFSMYEIGLLSALVGSLAISALFRKIL